jgi:hypothetical protein
MEQAQGPESGCKCSIGSNTYFFLCSTRESGQEKRAVKYKVFAMG